ncbi:hypothetical protein Bca4012_019799 [Brassica carinata]|uniref:Uncharacterized protein n=1 Tax=Brassica carinata TaxID=52824 RepID=A0A8X7WKV4_BRACI|nr:hypothetical protein Bca52824_001795 [Brassica carinata]
MGVLHRLFRAARVWCGSEARLFDVSITVNKVKSSTKLCRHCQERTTHTKYGSRPRVRGQKVFAVIFGSLIASDKVEVEFIKKGSLTTEELEALI